MLPRLDELERDLQERRGRALHESWLGEIEGIDLTLTFLRQKREQTHRHSTTTLVRLPTSRAARPGDARDDSTIEECPRTET